MTQEAGIRITAKNEARQAFQQFEKDADKAAKNAKQRFDMLSKSMKTAGVALTAFGAIGIAAIRNTTLLAARVQTLGVVMNTVGRTAGYSAEEMAEFEREVKKQGITTQVTRESLTRMIQAQLDLTKATELARIAQNAAVIAGINSSEAFNNMIYAINTLNPRVLKTMGLTISLEQAYSDFAKEQGITINQIDMQTKKQIAMNEVIEAGTLIADAYEAAMETAGKQLTSLPRHLEEAKLAVGEAFLPAFSAMIEMVTDLLKNFNKLPPSIKRFASFTLAAATAMSLFIGGALLIGRKLFTITGGLANLGSTFFSLGINIKALGTSAGFLTTKLAMLSPAIGGLAVIGVATALFVAWAIAIGKTMQFFDDLHQKNDELTIAVQKHNREIAIGAMTQAEYIAELERSVDVANRTIWTKDKEIITMEEWNKMVEEGAEASDLAREYVIAYTAAEREKLRAQIEAAEAAGVLDEAMGDIGETSYEVQQAIEAQAQAIEEEYRAAIETLNYLIGTDLSQSMMDHEGRMDSLNEKFRENADKLRDLEERYGDLVDVEGTWANQQKTELLGQLGESYEAIKKEEAAWEANTNQILFNMAARSLENLPVDEQAAALASLAEEMELVDPATANAWEQIGILTQHLSDGTVTTDEYSEAVTELSDYLSELPSDVFVNVRVKVSASGQVSLLGGGGGIPGTGGGGGGGGQTYDPLSSLQHGGWLRLGNGWTAVGEAGEEFIDPRGYVYNAAQTRALKRLGVKPGMGYQGGSGIIGSVIGIDTAGKVSAKEAVSSIFTKKRKSGSSPSTIGGAGGGASITASIAASSGAASNPVAQAAASAAATAATSAANQVAQETAAAIAASTASLGADVIVLTQQQTEQFRAMMRSTVEAAREQTAVLNRINETLEGQGSAYDIANAVAQEMERVEIG